MAAKRICEPSFEVLNHRYLLGTTNRIWQIVIVRRCEANGRGRCPAIATYPVHPSASADGRWQHAARFWTERGTGHRTWVRYPITPVMRDMRRVGVDPDRRCDIARRAFLRDSGQQVSARTIAKVRQPTPSTLRAVDERVDSLVQVGLIGDVHVHLMRMVEAWSPRQATLTVDDRGTTVTQL